MIYDVYVAFFFQTVLLQSVSFVWLIVEMFLVRFDVSLKFSSKGVGEFFGAKGTHLFGVVGL